MDTIDCTTIETRKDQDIVTRKDQDIETKKDQDMNRRIQESLEAHVNELMWQFAKQEADRLGIPMPSCNKRRKFED